MVSCMCIFSGRSNSTTKGPLTSPKAMCPETRSEWMERSLSAPPRAAMTLARISSAVCAAAATGSKQRSASPSAFVFMKFMVAVLEAGGWREWGLKGEAQRHRGGNWSNGDTPIPGVCVRVARKGLTRQGVRKSGRQRTYRETFLRFGATDEVPKGYATPGVLQKECGSC